jgi:hypothetical protein
MLHIRVVSPASVTGLLLARLAVLPGIQNLIVLEGAARRPDGDAVLFDVQDSAANPVFRALRDLGLDRADRAVMAALIRLLPGRLRAHLWGSGTRLSVLTWASMRPARTR